nr:GPI-anchored protein like [Ipomoea batatas]GMC69453.1 GPI-anchored protein like [Ipomoea batatas]GMD64902.1 GPI-anchored protein like [Ipomoea batatas]
MQNSKDSEMRYAFYRSLPTYTYWEFTKERTAELTKYPCLIRRQLLLSLLLPRSISTSSPSSSRKGRDPKEAYSKKPRSGFYITIVIDGEMVLLVGNSQKKAYSKTREKFPATGSQDMVLRREHVYDGKLYITRATIDDRDRNIYIDCRLAGDDPRVKWRPFRLISLRGSISPYPAATRHQHLPQGHRSPRQPALRPHPAAAQPSGPVIRLRRLQQPVVRPDSGLAGEPKRQAAAVQC